MQGVELLTTGRITLPVPEPDRADLRRVRRGEVPPAEVVAAVDDAEARLLALRDSTAVPALPGRAWVDGWLHRAHLAHRATLRWDGEGPGRRVAAGALDGSGWVSRRSSRARGRSGSR